MTCSLFESNNLFYLYKAKIAKYINSYLSHKLLSKQQVYSLPLRQVSIQIQAPSLTQSSTLRFAAEIQDLPLNKTG